MYVVRLKTSWMQLCHVVTTWILTMDTAREKLLRVQQIVKDGMLNTYKFPKAEEQEIVDFMLDKPLNKLRETPANVYKDCRPRKPHRVTLGKQWLK